MHAPVKERTREAQPTCHRENQKVLIRDTGAARAEESLGSAEPNPVLSKPEYKDRDPKGHGGWGQKWMGLSVVTAMQGSHLLSAKPQANLCRHQAFGQPLGQKLLSPIIEMRQLRHRKGQSPAMFGPLCGMGSWGTMSPRFVL